MSTKKCIIGDITLDIVSMSTNKSGYINIVAKPSINVVKSEYPDVDRSIHDSSKSIEVSEKMIDAISHFIEERKKQFPNFQTVRNARIDQAVIEVSKLLKKGFDENVIIECIKIGITNDFWQRNLMTLTQLNKRCKDELTKFEHLLLIYEDKNKRRSSMINSDFGPAYEEL